MKSFIILMALTFSTTIHAEGLPLGTFHGNLFSNGNPLLDEKCTLSISKKDDDRFYATSSLTGSTIYALRDMGENIYFDPDATVSTTLSVDTHKKTLQEISYTFIFASTYIFNKNGESKPTGQMCLIKF